MLAPYVRGNTWRSTARAERGVRETAALRPARRIDGTGWTMNVLGKTALVLSAVALAGCGSNGESPSTLGPGDGAGNRGTTSAVDTVSVAFGTQVEVVGLGVSIAFASVLGDSRCPVTAGGDPVTCVWEGNAELELEITSADGASVTRPINTTLEPRVIRAHGRSITLIGVDPVPIVSRPIDPQAYVAHLEIRSD